MPNDPNKPVAWPLAEDREPWERQPREKDPQWAAFQRFRDLPTDERTIRNCAKPAGIHETQIYRWAKGGRWFERVAAYDRHQDEVRVKAQSKAIEKMAERHANLANAALGVLQQPIAELVRRITDKTLNLTTMPDRDLLRLVRASAGAIKDLVSIERVARGEPAGVDAANLVTEIRRVIVDVGAQEKTVLGEVADAPAKLS